MSYRSYAEIERDNQDRYEESLANESERLSKLVGKEIDVIKREGDGYDEGYEITFMYRNHEYSIDVLYDMPAGYNDRRFIELIREADKEIDEEEEYNKKEIKAFEILRRKQFIYVFEENGEYWLSINMVAVSIPKEEYEVLKEVL